MTTWIAWSLLTSSLLAIASVALERVAAWAGHPRRFVVIAGMIAMTVGPSAVAFRVAPSIAAPSVNVTSAFGAKSTATGDRGGADNFRRPLDDARTAPSELRFSEDGARAGRPQTIQHVVATRGVQLAHEADLWIGKLWLIASVSLLLSLLQRIVTLERRRSQWYDTSTDVGPILIAREDGPAVVGVMRPRIVLPMWTLSSDPETRAMLLRHEVEHIRAGDTRVLMAAEMLLVAFPWNAPLWWMSKRLRLAIEMDCDARVIHAVGDAHAYGSVLLAVAERYAASVPFVATLTEPRLNLESRIRAIMNPRPKRPLLASWPLVGLAVIVTAVAGWTPQPTPFFSARIGAERATIPGIAFAIDTSSAAREARSVFDTFGGRLVFAARRGRLDIVSRPEDAPVRMINGNWVAAPLANAGDYYLFDSTGFILVRPATKTFSSFAMRDVSYNYRDERDGWPAMFDFYQVTSRGLVSGAAAADKLAQHGEIHVYWQLNDGGLPAGQSLARGRLVLADAPASEASVAQWFAAALALAGIAPSQLNNDVRITSIIPLSPPRDTRAPTNFGERHSVSSLRSIDVDASNLVLPADFVETAWPGFEHIPSAPALSRDGGAKWRTFSPGVVPPRR